MKDVVDPELGINVVDLGLVYDVHLDEQSNLVLDMTLTSAACPLTDVITDQTDSALEGLVNDVAINWVWMPPWGPGQDHPRRPRAAPRARLQRLTGHARCDRVLLIGVAAQLPQEPPEGQVHDRLAEGHEVARRPGDVQRERPRQAAALGVRSTSYRSANACTVFSEAVLNRNAIRVGGSQTRNSSSPTSPPRMSTARLVPTPRGAGLVQVTLLMTFAQRGQASASSSTSKSCSGVIARSTLLA